MIDAPQLVHTSARRTAVIRLTVPAAPAAWQTELNWPLSN
jgi:hypothetical protein